MSDNLKVLVIGAGLMAKEYVKVLKAQNYIPIVIGRGEEKARRMEQETGITVLRGGVENVINTIGNLPEYAIVAVSVNELARVTLTLLHGGVKNILVEKPGAMEKKELREITDLAKEKRANVYVAYNRRYYASTKKALEIIQQDGGVTSFSFEFTEWSHVIIESEHPIDVKEKWLLANSSHVIDLAFFLGGEPEEISCYKRGSLNWHSKAAVYAGAGISERGALFSYQANWEAPGRWGVEVLTKKHRLYLRPLEKLQVQEVGNLGINLVEIEDEFDIEYKPGLYREVEAFLKDKEDGKKVTIDAQLKRYDIYEKMEE